MYMMWSYFLKNYVCTYEKELRTKNLYIEIWTIGISGQLGVIMIFIFYFVSRISMYYFYYLEQKTSLFLKSRELSPSVLISCCHDNNVCANSTPFTASLPSKELYPVCDSIIHCNGKDCDALVWSMTSLYSSATGNKDTHSFFFIIVLVIIDNWRKWMAENNYG